jgi:very-short-patch-repair endonuclease
MTTKRTVAPQRIRVVPKRKGPDLEALFALQVRATGLPAPVKQHRFHPKRKWQFDFAWPAVKIAVEIDGGTAIGGRHVRPAGFRADCEKINAAQLLGWAVYRGDSAMIKTGRLLATVQAALNQVAKETL